MIDQTTTDNADEFLVYVSKNIDKLKRNLRKNITYDAQIFDDVFYDSVLKCYDSIKEHKIMVQDFERYFFRASKWNYIQTDNANRKQRDDNTEFDRLRDEYFEDDYDEEEKTAKDKIAELRDFVSERYRQTDADIFWTYFEYKADGVQNALRQVSTEFGLKYNDCRKIIRSIQEFLIQNYDGSTTDSLYNTKCNCLI